MVVICDSGIHENYKDEIIKFYWGSILHKNIKIWLFQNSGKKSEKKVAVAVEIWGENDIVLAKICQGNELAWVYRPNKCSPGRMDGWVGGWV